MMRSSFLVVKVGPTLFAGLLMVIGAVFIGMPATIAAPPEKSKARTLKEYDDGVFVVTYSPAGDLIATAGSDKVIRLWDAKSGALKRTVVVRMTVPLPNLIGEQRQGVAIEGKKQPPPSDEEQIERLMRGPPMRTREAAVADLDRAKASLFHITDLVFSPSGMQVAAMLEGSLFHVQIALLDVQEEKPPTMLDLFDMESFFAEWMKQPAPGVKGGKDVGFPPMPAPRMGAGIGRGSGFSGQSSFFAFAPDGSTLTAIDPMSRVHVWKPNGESVATFDGITKEERTRSFFPSINGLVVRSLPSAGSTSSGASWSLVTIRNQGQITFWKPGVPTQAGKSEKMLAGLPTNEAKPLQAIGGMFRTMNMVASTDAKTLAIAYQVMKVRDVQPLGNAGNRKNGFGGGFGQAGEFTEDYSVRLWRDPWKKPLHILKPGRAGATMAISPNGNYMALGSREGAVEILEVETAKVLQKIQVGKLGVTSLAFHPQSSELAIGSIDAAVKLVDMEALKSQP